MASGGASLPTAMPLPPPTPSVGRARSAVDGREREPAEVVAEALLVGALVHLDRRRPLAHQLHGGLAVADGRRLGVVVGGQEARLVRLERR